MCRTIAIAGAGVAGRLLAWRLACAGHRVEVVDPAPGPEAPLTGQLMPAGARAAGFSAAGMLSPLAEQEHAGPAIARLGWRSLPRWQQIAAALGRPELVRREGSLLLAHGPDAGAAQRVLSRLDGVEGAPLPQPLDDAARQALEPALAPDLRAWLLPGEGQLLPRELLQALAAAAPGVRWHWGRHARELGPHRLVCDDGMALQAELVIDSRGLGSREGAAAADWPATLRGVRGELVWLHAPGLQLTRPLRLLHPRHRVYIVPRPGDLFVVGASEIETEDRSPPSLRSAVELMAAAHSVLPGLAEGRIVHLDSQLRPALPDHQPRWDLQAGLLRLGGLFRHGWLLAPALVDDALAAWEGGRHG